MQYEPVYRGTSALYFGRIIGEKGVDRIIDAAKYVNIPIHIIGDGPDLKASQKKVSDYELDHVKFYGPMWGAELEKMLYAARFVIVPSLWHENFPYVIFQAFAAGKPVIGSKRGGIPELIGRDRGLLFEPDNPDELLACIKRLWADQEECTRMGKFAREYVVNEYNDDVIYQSLMSNYAAVMK
jgi:glycosyltransferase involved in cell wall biosynthesis